MMRRSIAARIGLVVVIALTAGVVLAQYGGGRRGRGRDRDREEFYDDDRRGIPDWENDKQFDKDVFTFVRVVYSEGGFRGGGGFGWDGDFGRGRRRRGYGGGGGWRTDWPDSDLNFSYRLQQLTSLKVNPDPVYMELTAPELFKYPFIYMIEPGDLYFSEPEVEALRKYLYAGGFLMVDDFWGDYQWENFYRQIKRVFPQREPEELDIKHPIFNIVYRLKEKPQAPSINAAIEGASSGVTWEPYHGGDCRTVHYKAINDDKGRMMVLICHNTDLGDGWEREGQNEWYFENFSQKKAYPMGINIVVYAMTH